MTRIKFEYKITFAYLLIGSTWILFSDNLLSSIVDDIAVLSEIQTFKGWFYVFVTSTLFFLFIKKHLTKLRNTEIELENHRFHLEKMVQEKTNDLETINEELKSINEELYAKNEIINNKNSVLESTLKHLKETQAQLFQSEKMASLGVLTAGVAHEINNPLNYIMGSYVGLLRHYDNNSFAENREQVGILINALKVGLDRSSAIVESLNQFSRSSKSYNEDCYLHEIIDNSINMLQNQIKQRIVVEKRFFNSDIIVKGNVGNLHQVFINILSNSIQAIASEGKISIETEYENSNVITKITDTGEGIHPENIEKLTDPFFTTKDPGKGIGLGLSITYNIIKEHQGRLEFQSDLGKGTTVKILLPVN